MLQQFAGHRREEPRTWDAALRLLAAALPTDRAAVVVLDELPYLIATDPGFEGTLQKLFDRELSRRPVLLICTHSMIARAAGGVSPASLSRALHLLAAKRLVDATTPLSARPSRETRYTGSSKLTGMCSQRFTVRGRRLVLSVVTAGPSPTGPGSRLPGALHP
ncbi:MAG: hypothetical protein ACT4NY_00915 [Pseudonocardiales bacterium]